jgi:hypothetical protein
VFWLFLIFLRAQGASLGYLFEIALIFYAGTHTYKLTFFTAIAVLKF